MACLHPFIMKGASTGAAKRQTQGASVMLLLKLKTFTEIRAHAIAVRVCGGLGRTQTAKRFGSERSERVRPLPLECQTRHSVNFSKS